MNISLSNILIQSLDYKNNVFLRFRKQVFTFQDKSYAIFLLFRTLKKKIPSYFVAKAQLT